MQATRRTFLKGAAVLASTTLLAGLPASAGSSSQPAEVRYALVGLGRLIQSEILPAFSACSMSVPAALVSGHPDKAAALAQKYNIDPKNIYNYENYDRIKDN